MGAELDRMEAEVRCALPALTVFSDRARARRLLDGDDPPTGLDAKLCRMICGD